AGEENQPVALTDNAEASTDQTPTAVDDRSDAHQPPTTADDDDRPLLSYGWFWGSISRRDAENLLRGKEEGTFLVRQSSDQRFLYSLSFRSNGKTMHTRIEYCDSLYWFYSNDSAASRHAEDGSPTLAGLIAEAMNQNNADNVFFYSRGLKSESSLHTV